MARNIEIKAYIDSVESIVPKAAALADTGPIEILQEDTFFECRNGRLKLRAFSATEGELIFYRRPDQAGPKESFYLISPTSAPDLSGRLYRWDMARLGVFASAAPCFSSTEHASISIGLRALDTFLSWRLSCRMGKHRKSARRLRTT